MAILRGMKRIAKMVLVATSVVAAAQNSAPSPVVWQMQDPGTTAGLRGIDSVDGKVAWASGTGGTVLKTIDGGAHWLKCAVPDAATDGATLDFRGVQAWDAETAIVMASGPGDKSRLYKTEDGCETWKMVLKNSDKDGFWDSVSVADQDNIMILGDPVEGKFTLLSSADRGKTWDRSHDEGLRAGVREGAFAASNSALLVNWVDGPAAFGTGSSSGARLFYECETCKTAALWRAFEMPSFPKGVSAGIFALKNRDWRRWIAVGGDYNDANELTGTAAWTVDGGKHWNATVRPPHGYRSAVQWSESLKIWITAGTNGSDISRDDGKTWQPLDNGNWNAISLPFIVGPNGRIARLNPNFIELRANLVPEAPAKIKGR